MRNMNEYVSEVILRLSRYAVQLEQDAGMMELVINRARRDVQLASLQLFRERYGRDIEGVPLLTEVPQFRRTYPTFNGQRVTRVFQSPLPADFIEPVAVWIRHCCEEAEPEYMGSGEGVIRAVDDEGERVGVLGLILGGVSGETTSRTYIGVSVNLAEDTDDPNLISASVVDIVKNWPMYDRFEADENQALWEAAVIDVSLSLAWGVGEDVSSQYVSAEINQVGPDVIKTFQFALSGAVVGSVTIAVRYPNRSTDDLFIQVTYPFTEWIGIPIEDRFHLLSVVQIGTANDHLEVVFKDPNSTATEFTSFNSVNGLTYSAKVTGYNWDSDFRRDDTKPEQDAGYLYRYLLENTLNYPLPLTSTASTQRILQVNLNHGLRVGGLISIAAQAATPSPTWNYNFPLIGNGQPIPVSFLDFDSNGSLNASNKGLFVVAFKGVGALSGGLTPDATFTFTVAADGVVTGTIVHPNGNDFYSGTITGTLSPLAAGAVALSGTMNGGASAAITTTGAIAGTLLFTVSGSGVPKFFEVVGTGMITVEAGDEEDCCCWWEARRVDMRELWNVSSNSWNRPTIQNPIYAIEHLVNQIGEIIYLSNGFGPIRPEDVRIFYIAALPYLELFDTTSGSWDVDMKIGSDMSELVILIALYRIFVRENVGTELTQQLLLDIENYVNLLDDAYGKYFDKQRLLLPSRENLMHSQPVLDQTPQVNGVPPNFIPVKE